ncbi:unnamed protein product [Linum tenue]|uniref:Uncharacterized protein n=1 Tax=Linum tenue TaxID=586396 RepID=A0AAV0Q230_9ROSI|nr:unnamed protein product [Linum tenue]
MKRGSARKELVAWNYTPENVEMTLPFGDGTSSELQHQALDRRYREVRRRCATLTEEAATDGRVWPLAGQFVRTIESHRQAKPTPSITTVTSATPSSIHRQTNNIDATKLSSPPPKAASRSVRIPQTPRIDGWKFRKKESVEDSQPKTKVMVRRVVSPASPIAQIKQQSDKTLSPRKELESVLGDQKRELSGKIIVTVDRVKGLVRATSTKEGKEQNCQGSSPVSRVAQRASQPVATPVGAAAEKKLVIAGSSSHPNHRVESSPPQEEEATGPTEATIAEKTEDRSHDRQPKAGAKQVRWTSPPAARRTSRSTAAAGVSSTRKEEDGSTSRELQTATGEEKELKTAALSNGSPRIRMGRSSPTNGSLREEKKSGAGGILCSSERAPEKKAITTALGSPPILSVGRVGHEEEARKQSGGGGGFLPLPNPKWAALKGAAQQQQLRHDSPGYAIRAMGPNIWVACPNEVRESGQLVEETLKLIRFVGGDHSNWAETTLASGQYLGIKQAQEELKRQAKPRPGHGHNIGSSHRLQEEVGPSIDREVGSLKGCPLKWMGWEQCAVLTENERLAIAIITKYYLQRYVLYRGAGLLPIVLLL